MNHNGGRALWSAVAICLLAFLFFGITLIMRVADQERIDQVATTTHEALCAFKGDLQVRADGTREFIIEIERGIRRPIAGIEIVDLQRSLNNQRDTLHSLSGLRC